MASMVWMSVFFLLVIELFITLLLVLPLPKVVRRFLAKKIFTYGLADRIRVTANFIFFGLLLAVADAISNLRHLTEKEENLESGHPGYPGEGQANLMALSLDKQLYLAGFALTLGFVIIRLIELMQEVVSGDEEKDKLNKKVAELEAAALSHEKRQTAPAAEDATDDQEGTPMTTLSSSLETNGLRRRTVSGENESISSAATNKDD